MIRVGAVKHNPDMLEGLVSIEQLCSDDAHIWFFEVLGQPFDPIRAKRFDIVIQKQKQFTRRDRRSEVQLLRDIKLWLPESYRLCAIISKTGKLS